VFHHGPPSQSAAVRNLSGLLHLREMLLIQGMPNAPDFTPTVMGSSRKKNPYLLGMRNVSRIYSASVVLPGRQDFTTTRSQLRP
jgi:hypothetical protein